MNRDVEKTSIRLIKEKIIKTDTVLNIVCERNATITDLQSKLDLVSVKFIEKCKDLSVSEEQRDTKDKTIYSLTTRLVHLQETYDQLAFDSNYSQSQSNEKYNENYLIIQTLESELNKLNDLVNKLKAENALLKEQSGANANSERIIIKATVKDLKGKIKCLENEVKATKSRYNLCESDLEAARKECEKLDGFLKNYKNNIKHKTIEKCLTCCKNASSQIEATLYKSNFDAQKEKYNKLYTRFEELQVIVNKLKNSNIEVAEKYSNLLLNQRNERSVVKKVDVSSQTIENKTLNDKYENEENRIVENKLITQLKLKKSQLKESLAIAIKEKRILQTDFNYLSQDNNKIQDKYESILLEKEVLLMENKFEPCLVSIETQTCDFLHEKSTNSGEIVDFLHEKSNSGEVDFLHEKSTNSGEIVDFSRNFDDLGLNLSDSDSENETSFCEEILEQMIRHPKIISPLPKTFITSNRNEFKKQLFIIPEIKITPASPIGNIDFLNDELNVSDSLSMPDDLSVLRDEDNRENDANFAENIIKINTNNESTQTDLCEDISKVNFGSQTVFDILTEERGIQCSKKYKNKSKYQPKALVKRKISKSRYKYNFKRKNAVKRNLKSALEVFRKYAISMSFENGNLLNLESKNKLQMNALNCFLFYKSNRLLKKFCRRFIDLKEALNIANRKKLTAVIINGSICDKKPLADNEIIDKNINEIIDKNYNEIIDKNINEIIDKNINEIIDKNINEIVDIKENRELNAIFDGEDNVKSLRGENVNLTRKKAQNLVKNKKKQPAKVLNHLKKIQIEHLKNLQTKFEMEETKILDKNEQYVSSLEVKNTKLHYTSSSADTKDNNSVDSGYTDGSITSESTIKEIKETNSIVNRVLRSAVKKKSSDTSPKANVTNKRRKIVEKDLFGSDDSDDAIVEKLVVHKKSRVKKAKVSLLEKMRRTIRNCNPRARNNTKILPEKCVKIDENVASKKQPLLVANGRKKATKSKHSFIQEISNENEEKRRKIDFESRKEIIKLNSVQNINKEDLIQRFISDIPVKKTVEKTTFKKALPRRKINLQEDSLVPTENILKNVDNIEVTNEESTAEDDDNGIKSLNRLIQYNCEESVISDVCDQLKQTSTKQISRLIIHCLYTFRSEGAQASHTPLAPNLSPAYKTLIGFANILSEKPRDIFTELLNQLEILFLLQNNANIAKKINLAEDGGNIQGVLPPTYSVMSLEQIYRFYVSVCMLRTEVLRLRRFLCDMAFYQRDGWYALMYAVFTIWPAVLPKHFNEDNKSPLKDNDTLLMKVLMLFVYKKRNSDEYMYYRPFLTTFAFGYYKYTNDSVHIKIIFDELVEKFTTSESNIIAYAMRILFQRITNADLMELLRAESFNNVFKASDEEMLIGKSKLLWLLDQLIPETKIRGDAERIRSLRGIFEKLQTRVQNEKVINFIQSCMGKLTS